MADEKLMYTVDKDDQVVYVRTLGKAVKNNAGNDLGDVEAGAQVNLVETMELVYGETKTTVTIANKKASIDLSDFAKKQTTLAGYGIADAYTKDQTDNAIDSKVNAAIASAYKPAGSVENVTDLGALSAANEGKVYNFTKAFTSTADFVEGAGKKYPVGTNVGIVNVGTDAAPSYKYDVLAGFIDTSDYDTHIADTTIHITAAERTAWNAKQDAITASNKLSADLIETSDAKQFISATEKATYAGKQDAISDLTTIRSNATAGKAAKDAVDAMGDIVSHDASEFAEASHNHAIADVTGLQAALNAKAVDTAVVHLEGAETITGNKTFSGEVALGSKATATTQAKGDSSTKVATTAFVATAVAEITGGDYLRYKEVIE